MVFCEGLVLFLLMIWKVWWRSLSWLKVMWLPKCILLLVGGVFTSWVLVWWVER